MLLSHLTSRRVSVVVVVVVAARAQSVVFYLFESNELADITAVIKALLPAPRLLGIIGRVQH